MHRIKNIVDVTVICIPSHLELILSFKAHFILSSNAWTLFIPVGRRSMDQFTFVTVHEHDVVYILGALNDGDYWTLYITK